MDKKAFSFLFLGFLAGGLLATVGYALVAGREDRPSGPDGQGEVLTLRLAHGLKESHPVHQGMEFMAHRLDELSSGEVKLKLFPNGQLGNETECLEQVQSGVLDMTKSSAAPMEAFLPEMGVFGLPYLFRDRDHYWRVLDGDVGEGLLDAGRPHGLRGLCYYDAGARSFYTSAKPVLEPQDLKGLKIRVMKSDMAMRMVEVLSGSPAPIPSDELYSALSQGMVDGAENNPPTYFSLNHYEVAKHFSLDRHTRIPDVLIIGQDRWSSLPEQVRAWLLQAAKESSQFQRESWQEASDNALEEVKRRGSKVYEPDPRAFAQKSAVLLDAIDAEPLKTLVREIQALQ